MKIAPKCLFTSKIISHIDYCIEDGARGFDHLSPADQDTLTAYCIDAYGDDAIEFLLDENVSDLLDNISQYLLRRKRESAHALAEVIHDNAISHFRPIINALFDERIVHYNIFVKPQEENYANPNYEYI